MNLRVVVSCSPLWADHHLSIYIYPYGAFLNNSPSIFVSLLIASSRAFSDYHDQYRRWWSVSVFKCRSEQYHCLSLYGIYSNDDEYEWNDRSIGRISIRRDHRPSANIYQFNSRLFRYLMIELAKWPVSVSKNYAAETVLLLLLR